jgi:hypothetical protein
MPGDRAAVLDRKQYPGYAYARGTYNRVACTSQDEPATPEHDAMRQAARFVLELMHLDRRTLAIVKARLTHPERPVAAISKSMGITDKAIYARLQETCREFPAAAILLGIESTRGRRKAGKLN